MATTTNLDKLRFNVLTEAQYQAAQTNNELQDNEFYLTEADDTGTTAAALNGGTTATSVADAEYIPISVNASTIKKITWTNIKVALALIFGPKPVVLSKTLAAANWSSAAQTVSDAAIYSATAPGDLKISQSASQTERAAWNEAKIFVTAQATGSITVTADGTVPTIDMPVIIEVR